MKPLGLFAILATWLLAACSSSSSCKADGDCPSGQICTSGACGPDTRLCGANQPFAPEVLYHAGSGLQGLASGDLNGDGKPDLAVADVGGTVQILLNNGDGTMRVTQPSLIVSGNPVNLAIADFNGDGKQDLAVTFQYRLDVFVLLGNGDGTFQSSRQNSAGSALASPMSAGDLNGDGKVDLAVFDPTSTGVVAMFGNGDGTFTAQPSVPVGSALRGIVVADLSGGNPDVAAVGPGIDGGLGVLLTQTGGMLGPVTTYGVGDFPEAVTAADFNGDGHDDLIVLDGEGTVTTPNGVLSILLGRGDGSFGPAAGYPVGAVPTALGVGDFNADGRIDAVGVARITASSAHGNVSLLLGQGDGTLKPYMDISVASDPGATVVADFNGDGHPDLAIAHGADDHSGQIGVLLNTCHLK